MKYIFKKWLGLGISYHTLQRTENKQALRIRLRTTLKFILNKSIINKNDGRIARISGVGIDKISSDKALNKSLLNGFTQEEHFKAGENIKELFENSTYNRSEKAKNNSIDIVAIHRYITLFQINDKDTEALITLKESVEHGNRIYSLELMELKPLFNTPIHTKKVQQGQV